MTNRLIKARNNTARLFSLPRRFFRLRGFGVHSPFAYSFLANAIREQHPYYAYKEINALTTSRSLQKFLRRVFRIAVVLKVKEAAAFGPNSKLLLRAATLAGAHKSEHPMLVVAIDDADRHVTLRCAENGGTVILGNIHRQGTNTQIYNEITRTIPHGMTFTDGKTAIFVGRHDLPEQTFHILL